jgi:hypothetical protein
MAADLRILFYDDSKQRFFKTRHRSGDRLAGVSPSLGAYVAGVSPSLGADVRSDAPSPAGSTAGGVGAVCEGPSRERVLRVLTCGTHKYSRWGTPGTHGFDRGVGLAVDRRAHAVAEVLVPLHRLAHLRGYSKYSHGVLRVLTRRTPSTHMGYSEYSQGVLRVLTWGTPSTHMAVLVPLHRLAHLRGYCVSTWSPGGRAQRVPRARTEGLRSARCCEPQPM